MVFIMKKITAILLICAMLCLCGAAALAAGFPDMQDGRWDWARSTVEKLTELKILKGYEDGTFKPDRSVTNEEAFTLFARSIGVEQAVNADAIAAARAQNAQTEAQYNTFAFKELSFMLYRRVLAVGELDKYLSAERQELPMLRHEAAILITKVMGGEQEVLSKMSYVMDYTDLAQIPFGSKGYVEYVKNHGIMEGMEDGSFSPMTTVTRAQICMMLDRTMQKMNLQYMSGTILAVDNDAKLISFSDGTNSAIYQFSLNATINLDSAPAALIDLKSGMSAIVTLSSQGVWAVDAKTAGTAPTPKPTETVPDSELSAIFSGVFSDSRGTVIKVYDKALGETSMNEYVVSGDVKCTYNGAGASLTDLKSGDIVDLKLAGGVVVEIAAKPAASAGATLAITGTVELVNTSLGFIIVNVTDASGAVSQKHVFVKASTSIVSNHDGEKLQLKDIQPGQMVMISGTENMGAFEATAIMVVTE